MDSSTVFSHFQNENFFARRNSLISLSMTGDEYHKAVSDCCYGDISNDVRLIAHEYSHWVQSAGTPYGYYLELVFHFENELMQQIEEIIAKRLYLKNGQTSTPPFKKYIEQIIFSDIHDESLWNLFGQWLDFFFLRMSMENRRDIYYEKVECFKDFLLSYPECRYTQLIDNYLFLPLLFHRVDIFLDNTISQYIGRSIPSKSSLLHEQIYSKKNIQASMVTGMNGLALQITHHSLWESFATVVEYLDIPEEFTFPSRTDEKGRELSWDEYYEPLRFLEQYLPSADYNKLLFLKSCVYLFDIVFSPPILPQCMLLREKEISIFDFDIVSRFYCVAQVARYVGPLNRFRSGAEYSTAICSVLHWHTPDEVYLQARRCWDSLNIIPAGKMFQHFINLRMTGECIFFNRQRFFCEVKTGHVKPCYLCLKDQIIFNTTFSYGYNQETQFDLMMQCVLFQQEAFVPEPSEDDFDYYQYTLLHELIEKLWETKEQRITLTIPKECTCIQKVKLFLLSWLENHYIEAQLFFE